MVLHPALHGSPGYVYAYAYGQLLALSVYQRYEQQGDDLVPRYLELLAAGGSRSPQELGQIVESTWPTRASGMRALTWSSVSCRRPKRPLATLGVCSGYLRRQGSINASSAPVQGRKDRALRVGRNDRT